MRTTTALLAAAIILIYAGTANAQKSHRDKAVFIDYTSTFWEEIKKSVEEFNKKDAPKKKTFQIDLTGWNLPKSNDEFKQMWHNEPISQGWSGMCWCFSTTSFLESEAYRIHKKKIKISELFTVYWEYIEKARRYVREHGTSLFSEGSQANAVTRIWKQYGCVPAESYTGLKPGQKFHSHEKMVAEMTTFLESLKKNNAWDEGYALDNIKSILNYYIGAPPETIDYGGKKMTPKQFLAGEVQLNPDDYVSVMSLMESPYYKMASYDVPDNWWKSTDYYNVPLDDFMQAIKDVVKSGYTMVFAGDVSESGIVAASDVAVVPSYDIPSELIDENARQLRFSNGSTTDDHGVHLVGWTETDGNLWLLMKDSGSSSRNGNSKGYYFFHEDYVKLKIMAFMVHRSAVDDLIKKFK